MREDSASKAADIAASQVESIVTAAEKAANQMRAEAKRESVAVRRDAEREAKRILKDARAQAKEIVAAARLEAMGVEDQARKDAEVRLEVAQDATDEALADARAMSQGLKRLGEALGDQAQQILRDVQAGHKRLTADLRIAGARERAPEPATPGPRASSGAQARADEAAAITELAARERERGGDGGSGGDGSARDRSPRRGSGGASAIDELDVPSWVEPGS
jgi:cell division septum initiation protein DivIVA